MFYRITGQYAGRTSAMGGGFCLGSGCRWGRAAPTGLLRSQCAARSNERLARNDAPDTSLIGVPI
ncbi:MAG: hypothetical protein LBT00_15470 [Spirochaetaceae bacterium]|nr:hypothetical protein [Spirochaetaceae bacterium]